MTIKTTKHNKTIFKEITVNLQTNTGIYEAEKVKTKLENKGYYHVSTNIIGHDVWRILMSKNPIYTTA